MQQRKVLLLSLPLFVAAIGFGWMQGRLSGTSIGSNPSHPAENQASKLTGTHPAEDQDYGNFAYARQRVARILSIRDPKERQRATQELAESIPAEDIPKWLEGKWFTGSEGFDASLFESILRKRLSEADPIGALKFIDAGTPSDADLQAAILNPRSTIEYFKKNGLSFKSPNAMAALKMLAAKSPELALDALMAASKSKPDPYSALFDDKKYIEIMSQIEKAQPGLLESKMASIPLSLRNAALTSAFCEKISRDPTSVIDELLERPDGLRIFKSLEWDASTCERLLKGAAVMNPGMRSYLAEKIGMIPAEKLIDLDFTSLGFTSRQRLQIQTSAILSYALNTTDRTSALKKLNAMNLDPGSRKSVIRNLFTNMDTQSAQSLLSQISDPEQRAVAESVLNKKSGTNAWNSGISDPKNASDLKSWASDAFNKVKAASGPSGMEFNQKITAIPPEKTNEFIAQFNALPVEDKALIAKRTSTSINAGGSIVKTIVSDGIKSAIESGNFSIEKAYNPNGKLNSYDAVTFASEWVNNDSKSATQWVSTLPSGDAKNLIQQELVTNWAGNDYKAAETWVKSLPATEQTRLKPILKNFQKR